MNKQQLNDSKYFEKIEINWFSITQINVRKNEFRNFYREILDVILENKDKILEFISKQTVKFHSNKTRKHH